MNSTQPNFKLPYFQCYIPLIDINRSEMFQRFKNVNCFYPIHVKTAEPIGPNFLWDLTDHREGLQMIKISKICFKQNLIFINFENPRNFFYRIRELFLFLLKCIRRVVLTGSLVFYIFMFCMQRSLEINDFYQET